MTGHGQPGQDKNSVAGDPSWNAGGDLPFAEWISLVNVRLPEALRCAGSGQPEWWYERRVVTAYDYGPKSARLTFLDESLSRRQLIPSPNYEEQLDANAMKELRFSCFEHDVERAAKTIQLYLETGTLDA
jgi:hypothetical protein